MENRTIPAAIVGVVAGLILGFFSGIAYRGQQSPAAPPPAASSVPSAGGTQALPENHPTKEIMDKVATLRAMADKDPTDKVSRIQLGNTFYDLAQYEQAVNWYAAALELDPKNVDVRTDMGTAFHFMGNHDRALQELTASLAIDPTHPQTLQNIGWVKYNGKKDYKGALEAWNKLLQTHPNYENADQVRKQIEQAKADMARGKN